MPRYFLKRLQIEGFRGINNQGEPLDLQFKSDSVNSVFAANALGKSSTFEALSYAIKGVVPKLERLPAVEDPLGYYANRFHGTGTSTVSVILEPDDGSPDVALTVTRSPAGSRSVSSPSGYLQPEQLLSSLDTELALLDYDLFLEFVNDTPLKRGRTFSGLLGLSPLSEFRQALEVLSNRRNLNTDLDLEWLGTLKSREEQQARDTGKTVRESYRKFFSKEADSPLDIESISKDTLAALKAIALISDSISAPTFDAVNFDGIREAVRKAEASDKRERLAKILGSIALLQDLQTASTEAEEKSSLRDLLEKHAAALSFTRGVLFQRLYASVQTLYDKQEWRDPLQCPACESSLNEPLPDQMEEKLQQYKDADAALREVHIEWNNSAWARRLKRLEDSVELGVSISDRRHAQLSARFNSNQPSANDLDAAKLRLDALDTTRQVKLGELQTEKDRLEKEIPPSLVALTEQIEHAGNLQRAIRDLQSSNTKIEDLEATLEVRGSWATFIEGVASQFAKAEVRLSTAKTTALEINYRDMYEKVTSNPEVVPLLKKSDTSEELYLRLAQFYGLSDLSAATLLPESYRNALAICIYLAAVLHSASPARFMVLDDVTSSFDAGHQWALMELIRTKIAHPANPSGPQVIILSHDGLLEKYFDTMSAEAKWHHQRLQGMPPKGLVYPHTHDVNRLEQAARQQLSAGQKDLAMPLIRQYLEQKLLQIIRRLDVLVRLDFSIRDDRKMVSNCLDAISGAIDLHKRAGDLILAANQVHDLETVYVPALIGNWVSHYATATGASVSSYVFLGVLDTINKVSECFMYSCTCNGTPQPRFYRNLTSKSCSCC
jgi:hypothetical protein